MEWWIFWWFEVSLKLQISRIFCLTHKLIQLSILSRFSKHNNARHDLRVFFGLTLKSNQKSGVLVWCSSSPKEILKQIKSLVFSLLDSTLSFCLLRFKIDDWSNNSEAKLQSEVHHQVTACKGNSNPFRLIQTIIGSKPDNNMLTLPPPLPPKF